MMFCLNDHIFINKIGGVGLIWRTQNSSHLWPSPEKHIPAFFFLENQCYGLLIKKIANSVLSLPCF